MYLVSTSTYNPDGTVRTSTQYDGTYSLTTTYNYDSRDRLTDIRSPANVVTHYVYDNLGRTTDVLTYADTDNDYFVYTDGIITGTNPEPEDLRTKPTLPTTTSAASTSRGSTRSRRRCPRIPRPARSAIIWPPTLGTILPEMWSRPKPAQCVHQDRVRRPGSAHRSVHRLRRV